MANEIPSVFDDLTSQWLKTVYLLGVDLTVDDGSPYPDEVYRRNIAAAVAWAQNTFHQQIDLLTVHSEQHDLTRQDRAAWFSFQLDHRPVLEITEVRMRYGSSTAVKLPLSWVKVTSAEQGQINLMPSAAGQDLGTFLFSSGIPLMTMGYAENIPAFFEFDYIAGMSQESGTVVLTGETPVKVNFDRALPKTDYEAIFAIQDFRPFVVSRTSTQFVAQLAVAPPGPITYSWIVPNLGRGTVTFVDGSPVTVNLARKTVNLSYPVGFTAPDFLPALTAKAVGSFTVKQKAPPAWAVPYEWRMSRVPADLRHWIGMRASMDALNIAGDLIGGAGIASSSVGVDGFSQSVNTTSSPENGGFSARIKEYERELPILTTALKGKYRKPQMLFI